MKLTGDLEKQVNSAKDRDEARQLIENAGMLLDDEELNSVAGGNVCFPPNVHPKDIYDVVRCPKCTCPNNVSRKECSFCHTDLTVYDFYVPADPDYTPPPDPGYGDESGGRIL